MRLEGVAAVVTGGASGLGRATALALVEKGASVVTLDRIGGREDASISQVVGDVLDEADVTAALDRAAELGPVRLCVNCAGIGTPQRIARAGTAAPLDDFRRSIDVNLVGTFNVARLAAARMQVEEEIDGERGLIVNTASIAAFEGQIGQVAYAASKGGIVSMTLPIARDLASSLIRCVAVAPGIIDTPLLGELSEDVRAALGRSVPHPARLGRPAEYAALVVHIAENQLLNGEVIRLDGALRMAPK
jgi:NAD(P)-dependent dehydrogenase (short-subunit alcohol dehydrogenase family)